MEALLALYRDCMHKEAVRCLPITDSGSNRKYYRLTGDDGSTVIGVVGTSQEENHAFTYLARHFAAKGLPVPRVLAESTDGLRYLQTDLGSRSLFETLRHGREAGGQYDERERALLHRTIALLPHIQMRGAEGLDFTQCYPQPEMDEMNVMFDLNYFKYCFLKPSGIDFNEMRLESDFRLMAQDITTGGVQGFLYRDFQARNVMLTDDGSPCFIDFQGGRRGSVEYDVASFLWQASALYPDDLRKQLTETYLTALQEYVEVDREAFGQRLRLFVLFRLLQVLGAYGYRGYFERKPHFLRSIPPAIASLGKVLSDGGCPYTYLSQVLAALVAKHTGKQRSEASVSIGNATGDGLCVRVLSFSYKKGIPEDESGNGGGYVFDCRATHNPGRYEPYKQLTGLDAPVIRFLEEDGEILTFLNEVYRLVDAHVARYLQRGFTHLMCCFGCTGGQHRSVYSAQHLAEHLWEKFNIHVELCHREQGITQTFLPRP